MHTLDLRIDDIAFGGKGVARDNGKVVFVPFTVDGERVKAAISREKKQFTETELVEVIEPSPDRVTPECQYFGRCGGCVYQQIRYERQLELKARQVTQAMQRIGRLASPPMQPIIPSPLPYGYRNRITVHAQDRVVGFYERSGHRLMDIAHCSIAMPEVNEALTKLRSASVRDGHYTLRASSGSRVFAQTNDAVADSIVESISKMISGSRWLIDAYCGAGFFAKRLAQNFEQVFGVDWDRFAIDAARKTAGSTETYVAGDVALELRRLLTAYDSNATTLIVDPPAEGLSPETRQTILEFPPQEFVYVSCNPPTLARDIAELTKRFSVISITPCDMFPQTAEIEVIAHLSRISPNSHTAA